MKNISCDIGITSFKLFFYYSSIYVIISIYDGNTNIILVVGLPYTYQYVPVYKRKCTTQRWERSHPEKEQITTA